jgi:outer membrane biogenesis lipoprotein LolB
MGYSEQIDIAPYTELPGYSSLTQEPIAQSRCNRLEVSWQQTPRSYKIAGTPLSNTIGHIQAHELKIVVSTICQEGYGATTSSDIHQVLRDKYGERGIR